MPVIITEWLCVTLDSISKYVSLVAINILLCACAISCVFMYLQILFIIMLHITSNLVFPSFFQGSNFVLKHPQRQAKHLLTLKKFLCLNKNREEGSEGWSRKHRGAETGKMKMSWNQVGAESKAPGVRLSECWLWSSVWFPSLSPALSLEMNQWL